MVGGPETVLPLTSAASFVPNLPADLAQQAIDATMIHAQAAEPPSAAAVDAIVNFELGLFTQPGINDSLGADITAAEALFGSLSMTIRNVLGLNDIVALNRPTAFVGHRTTCHDTPKSRHSLPAITPGCRQ